MMVDGRLDYRRLISRKVEVRVDRLDIINVFRLLEIRVGSWLEIRLSSWLDIRVGNRLVIRVVIFRFGVRVDTWLDIWIGRRLEIRVGLWLIKRFLSRLNRRFDGGLNYRVLLLQKVRHKSYLL
jgi:hypothetical protein